MLSKLLDVPINLGTFLNPTSPSFGVECIPEFAGRFVLSSAKVSKILIIWGDQ